MLRFFSRRKVKGRADQKVGGAGGQGGQGSRRFSGKYNKNILNCNIMLLDGSDLAIEIGVSLTLTLFLVFFLNTTSFAKLSLVSQYQGSNLI